MDHENTLKLSLIERPGSVPVACYENLSHLCLFSMGFVCSSREDPILVQPDLLVGEETFSM